MKIKTKFILTALIRQLAEQVAAGDQGCGETKPFGGSRTSWYTKYQETPGLVPPAKLLATSGRARGGFIKRLFLGAGGQSLIEVVLALGVAALVIFALVRLTATSVRNTRFARDQALATKYSQEVVELMRTYREENGWAQFVANCERIIMILSVPFNQPEIDCHIPDRTDDCRVDESCEVEVTISWVEGDKTHSSVLTTRFTDWR